MHFNILFGLAAVLFVIDLTAASTPYRGCYHDVDGAEDMDELRMTFEPGDLTVEACVEQCRENGAPYAGIRRGQTCFCGMHYGRYGLSDHIYCNYTCSSPNTDQLRYCGGVHANSIYYALDGDDSSVRSLYAHAEQASFKGAREKCVQTNGDLAIVNYTLVNSTMALFNDYELTSLSRKFWIGLEWENIPNCGYALCLDTEVEDPADCDYFEWVDKSDTAPQFRCEDNGDPFAADETFQNECVVVNMDTGRFETTNCFMTYPFLCFSERESVTDELSTDDYEEISADAKKEDDNLLALYIVMPLFIFCYGGSCVLYCIHKIYRNCKRRRRNEKLLLDHQDEDFTEFEPDTKPSYDTHSKPEPLRRSGTSSMFAGSRPTTSEGVRIDMAAPVIADPDAAPAYYKKSTLKEKIQKMRLEKRRSRLLENALKEARERRGRENSDLGAVGETNPAFQQPPPPYTKPTPTQSIKSPRISGRSSDRSSQYRKSPTGNEFSPSSSLMGDERNTESPDDPTMMSIADIMRVKQMMKEKKKRVRKILSS